MPLFGAFIITDVADYIYSSQNSLGIGGTTGDTDTFNLDVYPDDMTWTATLNDTGDGTAWVGIYDDSDNDVVNPNTGTGDQTGMYAKALQDGDVAQRECTVTISDTAGEAESITLTISQMAAPE